MSDQVAPNAENAAPELPSSVKEMKKAVVALGLEVPGAVWDDVRQRWNAVAADIRTLASENEELRLALHTAWLMVRVDAYDAPGRISIAVRPYLSAMTEKFHIDGFGAEQSKKESGQ